VAVLLLLLLLCQAHGRTPHPDLIQIAAYQPAVELRQAPGALPHPALNQTAATGWGYLLGASLGLLM
jgi:hypothetical protein